MDNRIPAEKTHSDTKESTPTSRQRQFSISFYVVYKVLYFVYKWIFLSPCKKKYMRLSRIQ